MTTNRNGMSGGVANGAGAHADKKIDQIKDKVRQVVDQSHEKVDQLKHKAMDAKETVMSRGNDAVGKATEFIRMNPIKAVAIAFGVGYLGMRLIRR